MNMKRSLYNPYWVTASGQRIGTFFLFPVWMSAKSPLAQMLCIRIMPYPGNMLL